MCIYIYAYGYVYVCVYEYEYKYEYVYVYVYVYVYAYVVLIDMHIYIYYTYSVHVQPQSWIHLDSNLSSLVSLFAVPSEISRCRSLMDPDFHLGLQHSRPPNSPSHPRRDTCRWGRNGASGALKCLCPESPKWQIWCKKCC